MTFWRMECVFAGKVLIFGRLTRGHYAHEILHKNWVLKTNILEVLSLEKGLKYSFEAQNLSCKTTLSVSSLHQNCLSSIDPSWNIFLSVFDHGEFIEHCRDFFQPWENWIICLGIFEASFFEPSVCERVRCSWEPPATFWWIFWILQEILVLWMYVC